MHLMRNPKLSIVFTKRQLDLLKREAAKLGITVSELIRRIVDSHIEKKEKTK